MYKCIIFSKAIRETIQIDPLDKIGNCFASVYSVVPSMTIKYSTIDITELSLILDIIKGGGTGNSYLEG